MTNNTCRRVINAVIIKLSFPKNLFQLYFFAFDTPGGDEVGGETGFLGCMRFLEIGTERIESIPLGSNFGVLNGTCSVQDR